MSLYIRLNKEISPQKLLNDIQQEINKHLKQNERENAILCIDIRNTPHIIDDTIKKIRHIPEKSNEK